jgi:CHAD domain-containing protein
MAPPSASPAGYSVPARPLDRHLTASWEAHRRRYRSAYLDCRRNPTEQRVHRLRVSLRRLLAHLDALAAAAAPPAVRQTRKKLRSLLQATAAARDAQVQCRLFARGLRRDRRRERRNCARRLQARVVRHAGILTRYLRAHPTQLKSVHFGDFLDPPRAGRETWLQDLVRRSCRQSLARLRRLLRAARSGDSVGLHRARLAVKEMRYLTELLPAPGGAWPGLGSLQALQSALGELHDMDLLLLRLEKMAARHPRFAGWWRPRKYALRCRRAVMLASLPELPSDLARQLPGSPVWNK